MERESMSGKGYAQMRLAAALMVLALSGCAEPIHKLFPMEEVQPKQEKR